MCVSYSKSEIYLLIINTQYCQIATVDLLDIDLDLLDIDLDLDLQLYE